MPVPVVLILCRPGNHRSGGGTVHFCLCKIRYGNMSMNKFCAAVQVFLWTPVQPTYITEDLRSFVTLLCWGCD